MSKPTIKPLAEGPASLYFCFILFCLSLLSGCGNMAKQHYRSSVVDYLYPKQEHTAQEQIPALKLPLSVGIAFVPDNGNSAMSEAGKLDLMNSVKQHFEAYPFVRDIQLIPSTYLRAGGSFDNLNQLKLMHNIDVIALLSYDQKQFTDEGFASISYLTLVGAYLFRGEKNDTQTMMDATVYHIDSQKLLFRAPGVNHIKSSATPVNLSQQLRKDRNLGLQNASEAMITALDVQLHRFRNMAMQSPGKVQLHYSDAYRGTQIRPAPEVNDNEKSTSYAVR